MDMSIFEKEVKRSVSISIISFEVIIFLVAFGIGVYQGMNIKAIKADTVPQYKIINGDILVPTSRTKAFANPTEGSLGEQKTLVLLARYLDSGQHPFTLVWTQDRIFNGPFQKFYKEQSYDKTFFSGKVYDWSTIPENIPVNFCDILVNVDSKIGPIIKANKIDVGQYDRIVIIADNPSGASCSNLGKYPQIINGVEYNISVSLINGGSHLLNQHNHNGQQTDEWISFDNELTHEMGHALGVGHSNGWNCGRTAFSTPCLGIWYGNHYDNMGGTKYAFHFNAHAKELLGWITPSSSLVITKSGRYTINLLETSSGIKLAKIKLANGTTPFYLEYRKAIGFDSLPKYNLNGLFVNYVNPNIDPYSTYLVDASPLDHVDNFNNTPCAITATSTQMTPGVADCWATGVADVSLKGANTFVDFKDKLIIGPIISEDSNSITFDVIFSCKDSDGGKNFYVKGTASGVSSQGALNITDSCKSTSTLLEGYCDPSKGFAGSQEYVCPHGCRNGACICATTSECPGGYTCSKGICAKIIVK